MTMPEAATASGTARMLSHLTRVLERDDLFAQVLLDLFEVFARLDLFLAELGQFFASAPGRG